jgi:hypothetical protein
LKPVEERAGNALEATGIDKDFLGRTQLTQQLREKISKWDYMKLNGFCTTKETGHPWNGRKSLLAIHQTRD